MKTIYRLPSAYHQLINKLFGIAGFVILSSISLAQPLYTFSFSTGNEYDTLATDYVDLFVGDADYDTWDEGLSDTIPIGFSFIYNFKTYTHFKVSANGFVTLDDNFAWNDELWWNYLSSGIRKLVLAPLWDDLIINTEGGIRYETTGTPGNKILKIEFYDLSFWLGGSFHFKYQVWLYEGTNEIEFRYGDDGSTNSWYNYSDEGVSIGISDERNNSFMSITPGAEPSYSFSDDNDAISSGDHVTDGLIYKFTPTTRWIGATSNDWLTKTNWELDTIPSATDNALIPDSAITPVINSSGAICENLTIESGGDLRITGGGSLTVEKDLVNKGTLTVTSTSQASTGSLIVNGNTDATITFERYLTGGNNWHLVSSPVMGQDIWDWATATTNNISTSSAKYAITNYIEANDNWDNYPTSNQGETFIPGKGYSTLRASDGKVSFTGQINIDDISEMAITYNNQGWNLLGNPFTSAIGATNSAASSQVLLSATNVNNLDPNFAGLYLWDPTVGSSGEYVIINNAGGTPTETLNQDYIQAGQGFFVRAKDNSTKTFSITKLMQAHVSSAPLKSEVIDWPTLKLTAVNEERISSTTLKFHSDMTTGLDITYDAGMFKTDADFALFTRLIEDTGVDFAIQCLPTDYNNIIIPVGIDAAAGTEVTFSADLFNIKTSYKLSLEDRTSGRFYALEPNKSFKIVINENHKNAEGLFVHTHYDITDINNILTQNDAFKIRTNRENGYIQIISSSEKPAQLKIIDIMGRVHVTGEVYHGNDNKFYFNQKPGLYVVYINNEAFSLSKKFVWTR